VLDSLPNLVREARRRDWLLVPAFLQFRLPARADFAVLCGERFLPRLHSALGEFSLPADFFRERGDENGGIRRDRQIDGGELLKVSRPSARRQVGERRVAGL